MRAMPRTVCPRWVLALLAYIACCSPAAAESSRVFGYQPWWVDGTPDWANLTHLAWFSLEAEPDGSVSRPAWQTAVALREEARVHGVRFVLTVTLFGGDDLHTALHPPARDALLDHIVDAFDELDADGINIDFEGLHAAERDAIVSFAIDLREQLLARRADAELTLATPAVDWSDAWDYGALARETDGLVVMAYGVHWSGGDPGPLLPLDDRGAWPPYTLEWIIDDYRALIAEAHHPAVTIALPLYGYDWPTTDLSAPGRATGKATAVSFGAAWSRTRAWRDDTASGSTWYAGGDADAPRQIWVDDPAAFAARVDVVEAAGMGVGLWALGYYDPDDDAAVTERLAAFRGGQAAPEPTETAETHGIDPLGTDAQDTDAPGADADGAPAGPALDGSADDGVHLIDGGPASDADQDPPAADAGPADGATRLVDRLGRDGADEAAAPTSTASCDPGAVARSGSRGGLAVLAVLLLGLAILQTLLMWRDVGSNAVADYVSRGRFRVVLAALLSHAVCVVLTTLLPV